MEQQMEVPGVPLREEVGVHLIPDPTRGALEVRIWWNNRMVHCVTYPLRSSQKFTFEKFLTGLDLTHAKNFPLQIGRGG